MGSYQMSETCTACPVASYQPNAGQTVCLLCPRGTTTTNPGAVVLAQCVSGQV